MTRLQAAFLFLLGLGVGLLVPREGREAGLSATSDEVVTLGVQEGTFELPPGVEDLSARSVLKALRLIDPEGHQVSPMAREVLLAGSDEEGLDRRLSSGMVLNGKATWTIDGQKSILSVHLTVKKGKKPWEL